MGLLFGASAEPGLASDQGPSLMMGQLWPAFIARDSGKMRQRVALVLPQAFNSSNRALVTAGAMCCILMT